MTTAVSAVLAPDRAVPMRDALLCADPSLLPVATRTADVVRCKYRFGESLRVVYRTDHGQLVSVRASAGREPRWWVFPDDRRLAQLADLLSPTPSLRSTAGADWVYSEIAEYAPERSITVRAFDANGRVVAYAKQYAAGTRDVAALAQRYNVVARHLGGGSPRSLGHCRDVLVLEPMSGCVWAEMPPAESAVIAARFGRAIAAMHDVPAPDGTPTYDRLGAARLVTAGEVIARACPHVATLVDAVVRRLVATLPVEAPVLLHGDCHPKNVIVDGHRVSLIDLDQAAMGSVASDIGSFLARMRVATLVGRHDRPTEHILTEAFCAGYGSSRPLPAFGSLRWHSAAALVGEQAIRAVNRVRLDVLAVLTDILTTARDLVPEGRP